MSKKLFGLTEEQIRRQSGNSHAVDPESKMGPINPDDGFLEPCIRGSQKFLGDHGKREMLYNIYRGKKKSFVERLTDEQINVFLESNYPKEERYSFSFNRYETFIYVRIDQYNGDCTYNFSLYDFHIIGACQESGWIKYLYQIFGTEYKQAYLDKCAKIFD